METACQRALEAHLLSYRDVKGELEALTRPAPAAPEATVPLPAHENIRGKTYYQ
jgi:hypothetical protein